MKMCKGRAGVWHPFRKQSRVQPGAAWLSWAVPAAVAAWGVVSGKSQNEKNIALSREQMDFQEKMSNTSFQRGVRDMMAAGLSPMLAYSQGGATTPQGATARVENPVSQGMSSGVQAMQVMQGMQGIAQSEAQTENYQAQTEKIKSETVEKQINTAQRVAEMEKSKEDAARAGIDFQRAREQWLAEIGLGDKSSAFAADVEKRKAETRQRQAEAEQSRYGVSRARVESKFYDSDLGEMNPLVKQLLDVLRGVSSAASASRR